MRTRSTPLLLAAAGFCEEEARLQPFGEAAHSGHGTTPACGVAVQTSRARSSWSCERSARTAAAARTGRAPERPTACSMSRSSWVATALQPPRECRLDQARVGRVDVGLAPGRATAGGWYAPDDSAGWARAAATSLEDPRSEPGRGRPGGPRRRCSAGSTRSDPQRHVNVAKLLHVDADHLTVARGPLEQVCPVRLSSDSSMSVPRSRSSFTARLAAQTSQQRYRRAHGPYARPPPPSCSTEHALTEQRPVREQAAAGPRREPSRPP